MRVKVMDGKAKEFLGEGTLAGRVTVHAFAMPDGSLRSAMDPEVEPDAATDAAMAAEGGVKVRVVDNPR